MKWESTRLCHGALWCVNVEYCMWQASPFTYLIRSVCSVRSVTPVIMSSSVRKSLKLRWNRTWLILLVLSGEQNTYVVMCCCSPKACTYITSFYFALNLKGIQFKHMASYVPWLNQEDQLLNITKWVFLLLLLFCALIVNETMLYYIVLSTYLSRVFLNSLQKIITNICFLIMFNPKQ